MGEKIASSPAKRSEMPSEGNKHNFRGGTHEVRQMPFDKNTFRDICKKFYVHASISRVMNRADVPLFSRAVVNMGGKDSDGLDHSAIGMLPLSYNITTLLTLHESLQLQISEHLEGRSRFDRHILSTQQIDIRYSVWLHRSYRNRSFEPNYKCQREHFSSARPAWHIRGAGTNTNDGRSRGDDR